jgi:hypothetical protein
MLISSLLKLINTANAFKSFVSRLDICPVHPTKIYEPLQVIGFEGAFWFEVFLFEIDFLVYVFAFVNWSFQ